MAATYESGTSDFWHNLTRVNGPGSDHGLIQTAALPAGVDPLKAGVAAALAVIAARKARGGRFATPIGGATKRKR